MKRKRLLRVLVASVLGLVFFLSSTAFYDAWKLRTRFPRIHYLGPKIPPEVVFEKKAPTGWVRINEISTVGAGAVIVSEDWAFYQHHGVDLLQIKEAVKANLKRKKYARGASTITQQVAKNLFLGRDKTLWRKFREFILAVALESVVGKRKILEAYFNIAEWGEGLYGIRDASSHYFGISPAHLGPKEGAFLAMLLPNPKKYSVSYREGRVTPYAERTMDRILMKMVQAGFLDLETAKAQAYDPLSFEHRMESETGDQPPEGETYEQN